LTKGRILADSVTAHEAAAVAACYNFGASDNHAIVVDAHRVPAVHR
jgi:hypothetical protein